MERMKVFNINPIKLYPTSGIPDIHDLKVKECCEYYVQKNKQKLNVMVFEFRDHYYIYEGHEQVVAAANLGKDVDVVEIDRNDLRVWKSDVNFMQSLANIGLTAVYDFETICGFEYVDYPSYYVKEGNVE